MQYLVTVGYVDPDPMLPPKASSSFEKRFVKKVPLQRFEDRHGHDHQSLETSGIDATTVRSTITAPRVSSPGCESLGPSSWHRLFS